VLTHPHTLHRKMVYEQDEYRGVGAPLKLSRTPPSLRRKPPRFGEANREVLREAGYSAAEIDRLIADGVVATSIRPAAQE
jgi:crotonobetainyl-CoA:carnitine CoA-transferase CaiB-like acyl-CoA transferase